jgi:hypothetical protein
MSEDTFQAVSPCSFSYNFKTLVFHSTKTSFLFLPSDFSSGSAVVSSILYVLCNIESNSRTHDAYCVCSVQCTSVRSNIVVAGYREVYVRGQRPSSMWGIVFGPLY